MMDPLKWFVTVSWIEAGKPVSWGGTRVAD